MPMPLLAVTTPDERAAGQAVAQRWEWQYKPSHTKYGPGILGGIQTGAGYGPESPALLGAGGEAATDGARLNTLPGFNPSACLSSLN